MARKSNLKTEDSGPALKPVTKRIARHHRAAGPMSTVAQRSISHDEIAQLAYSYWQSRGFQGGTPEADWERAEHELRSRI